MKNPTMVCPKELQDHLKKLKIVPEEPLYRVVERLLKEGKENAKVQ